MHESTGCCKGCFRTSEEIASWPYYSNEQKHGVLALLKQRREHAGHSA